MAYVDGPWTGWTAKPKTGCSCCACDPDKPLSTAHFRWWIRRELHVDLCGTCTGDWLATLIEDHANARIEAL